MPRRAPIKSIDDPRYLKAVSHPVRVRILALLDEGPASPKQLADRLGASLGVVAYHVRTLHDLDLLKLVGTRQRRGATEHIYAPVPRPAFSDDAWAAMEPVAKQRLLGATLRQIGEYANASAAAGGFDRPEAGISRLSVRLDERGFKQLAAASKKWLAEVQRIEEGAGKRRTSGDELAEAGLVLLLFEARVTSGRTPGTLALLRHTLGVPARQTNRMWPDEQPGSEPRPHAYDLYEDGRQIGALFWRARPRRAVGWYLSRTGQPEHRLFVDAAIEELARDQRSSAHDWELHAELAAILSTALALDAAGRVLYPDRERRTRRFRRGLRAGRYEIHVADVDTAILARAVPELHLDAVSNVAVLAGELMEGGLENAMQRVTLIGGRVVAVFRNDEAQQ